MTDLSPVELVQALTKKELAEQLLLAWARLDFAMETIRQFPRIIREELGMFELEGT